MKLLKMKILILCFVFTWLFLDTCLWQSNMLEEKNAECQTLLAINQAINTKLSNEEFEYRETLNNIVVSLYAREKFQIGGVDIDDVRTKDINNLVDAIQNQTTDFNQYLQYTENFFDARKEYQKNIPSILPMPYNDSVNITDPYGYRYYPMNNSLLFHTGLDITADVNTPILATADGVVESTNLKHRIYGRVTVIDHGNGFKTLYGHQRYIYVKVGQKVTQGMPIGMIGNSGQSSGRHLHYTIYVDDKPVDPLDYLNSVSGMFSREVDPRISTLNNTH